MVQVLKYVLLFVWVFMVYIVISTSLESNLYKEWDYLAAIPWMRATLWDFYANILIIYLWVIYKEKNILVILLWAVLFFCRLSFAPLELLPGLLLPWLLSFYHATVACEQPF